MTRDSFPDDAPTSDTVTLGRIRLGMFAKYWTPGNVKTRLASDLGDDVAANVYKTFFENLCHSLGSRFRPSDQQSLANLSRSIVFSPATMLDQAMQSIGGPWDWTTQQGDDLGERMRHWFYEAADGFDSGDAADRPFLPKDASAAGGPDQAQPTDRSVPHGTPPSDAVLVIGSDCPTVSHHTIRKAIDHLGRNDLVIGPASDGGYYLLGIRTEALTRCDSLFANIPWSSDKVLSLTLRNANQNGLAIGMLELKDDVDTIEDLNRLRDQLRTTKRTELHGLRQRLDQLLPPHPPV
ncbi:TIGR04282 family arsenosugar biosynthesis glycosyltransferase [Crateriforma conspicua]|uniref:TIGR04282 family arsenosugar biosynthesis glycosyltransferase n=1 Tax=Crateriforma conspicua TaxID=2527996 RepID=UPI00118A6026|nr:TIGR04282 family arsenosugar biosynthesis glycosyltransferase [Crateriforma conspicua]QDV65407.1 2-phospho-L-lactate guanylyltransferase [Crateriforma conspicua]